MSNTCVPTPRTERFLFLTGPREGCYVWGRILAFIVVFEWIHRERLEALKEGFFPTKKLLSASQVLVFQGTWRHRFNQAWLNCGDGPSGPSFNRCFHPHFPFFRLHLHPFWVKLAQCDDHWGPADSCQPPHLEANCWDGKQQASFPADKNTNMNCYYYYPISRLSSQPWIFSHPSPVGCQ